VPHIKVHTVLLGRQRAIATNSIPAGSHRKSIQLGVNNKHFIIMKTLNTDSQEGTPSLLALKFAKAMK